MAGTWVRTGTVAVTNGSKKITGNGTAWLSNPLQKVGKGCMCVIDNVISEVDYVNSDTELYLVEAWEGATASGKKYKIQVTVTDTIPELSSRISQSLAYANSQYGNLESWATGAAANVTLTGPAGNQVTLPNLSALNSGPSGPVEFDLRSPAQLLRWRNYGTGHTIFDASNGKSPINTDISNINPDVPWIPTYPTIVGWNGGQSFGVRVDSARRADSAGSADGLAGGIFTTAFRDLRIYSKRALVGYDTADGNQLVINYAGDFGSVLVDGALTANSFVDMSCHPAAHEYNGNYQAILQVENIGTMDPSDNISYWVRCGVQAFVHGIALIKDTSPFNEALLITLPFIVPAAQEYYPTGSLAIYNATLLNGIRYIWMEAVKGTSSAYLYCIDGAGVSRPIKANDISSSGSGHFRFSISYGV